MSPKNNVSFLRRINHWRKAKFRQLRDFILLTWYFTKYQKHHENHNLDDISLSNSIALMMLDNGIGDTIVMSGLIHELRQAGKKVYCICNPRTAGLFTNMIDCDGIYVLPERPKRKDILALNLSFDAMVLLSDPDKNLRFNIMLLTAINYKFSLGFNHKDNRFFDLNIIREEQGTHWSDRMADCAHHLGVTIDNYQYHLKFTKDCIEEVDKFINTVSDKKLVVFNPVASDKFRSLSPDVIRKTLLWLQDNSKLQIVAYNIFDEDIKRDFPTVIFNPFKQVDRSIALLGKSSFLITVDTSFVHAGRFFNTPMIGIYNNRFANKKYDNNKLWGPNYDQARQVFSLDHLNTETGDDLRLLPFSELEKALSNSKELYSPL